MSFRSVLGLRPNFCGPTGNVRTRLIFSKAALYGGEGQMFSEGTETKAQRVEKKFWMRDPSTGDWIPEDHIGRTVDVAELREKLLSDGKQTV